MVKRYERKNIFLPFFCQFTEKEYLCTMKEIILFILCLVVGAVLHYLTRKYGKPK